MILAYNLLFLAVLLAGLVRIHRREPGDRVVAARQGLLALGGAAVLGAALDSSAGFGRIQLMAWVVFVHLPLYLGAAAVMLRSRRGLAMVMATLSVATVLVALDAFVVEPRWLEVTRFEISTDKLDAPLTVALIADIQTDRPGDWERHALARVAAEDPDLVLFAGDYLQVQDQEEYREAVVRLNAIIKEVGLAPPLGIVAVRGNVDRRSWAEIFEGTGAVTAEARKVLDLGPITLTALSVAESFEGAEIDPADGFHIVLGHAPDFALDAPPADLMVAGHTHGGQVRIPFLGPIFTLSRVPRAWAAGATELDFGGTLVVSRGLGMERDDAPRMRFLCRPEVIFIDLVPYGTH